MADLTALIAKYDKRVAAMNAVIDETPERVKVRTPVDHGDARKGWVLKKTAQFIEYTNPVPYIRALEYGWSDQAPKGMVRIELAELPARLRAVLNGI